jgi:hypothetical protein
MDNRQIALVIGRARAVIGIVSLVLPGLVNRVFLGAGAANKHAKALSRMVGVRDLTLGVGTMTSVKEQTQGPDWLSMGAVADGVDALVALAARGVPRRTKLIGIVAAANAVVSLKIARDLADERARTAASPVEPGA